MIKKNSLIKQQQIINGNGMQQPLFPEEGEEEYQQMTKVNALPNSSLHHQLSFSQNPPQMVPSQLAYQVNFPINSPIQNQ